MRACGVQKKPLRPVRATFITRMALMIGQILVIGVRRCFIRLELALYIAQQPQIVHRMHVAGDRIGQSTDPCPVTRVFRQKGRGRINLIQPFQNGKGEALFPLISTINVEERSMRTCGDERKQL